jgi:hypothetical protein
MPLRSADGVINGLVPLVASRGAYLDCSQMGVPPFPYRIFPICGVVVLTPFHYLINTKHWHGKNEAIWRYSSTDISMENY